MTYLPDVEAVWREFARVARPGGIVVRRSARTFGNPRVPSRGRSAAGRGCVDAAGDHGPGAVPPQGYGGTPEVGCYYLTAVVSDPPGRRRSGSIRPGHAGKSLVTSPSFRSCACCCWWERCRRPRAPSALCRRPSPSPSTTAYTSAPVVDIAQVRLEPAVLGLREAVRVKVPNGFQPVPADRLVRHQRRTRRQTVTSAPAAQAAEPGGKLLKKAQEVLRLGGGWGHGGKRVSCSGSEAAAVFDQIKRGQRNVGIFLDLWWCAEDPQPRKGTDSGSWRAAVSLTKGKNQDMAPTHPTAGASRWRAGVRATPRAASADQRRRRMSQTNRGRWCATCLAHQSQSCAESWPHMSSSCGMPFSASSPPRRRADGSEPVGWVSHGPSPTTSTT